jgi:hypothetical protein
VDKKSVMSKVKNYDKFRRDNGQPARIIFAAPERWRSDVVNGGAAVNVTPLSTTPQRKTGRPGEGRCYRPCSLTVQNEARRCGRRCMTEKTKGGKPCKSR